MIKYKKKRSKAQSDLITIILIILIIIILIAILWNLILGLLKKKGEIIDLRMKLMNERASIDHIELDKDMKSINVSVERGPAQMKLVKEEKTITYENSPADIVSIVDMSGSMYISETSSCVGISEDNYCNNNPKSCCCQINPITNKRLDCSKAEDCAKCNFGTIENDPVTGNPLCIFHKSAPFNCWDFQNNQRFDYTTQFGCSKCGGWLEDKCTFTLPVNKNTGPTITLNEDDWIEPYLEGCNASGGDAVVLIPGELASSGYQYHCIVKQGVNGACANSVINPNHCLTIDECKNNNGKWNQILNACEFYSYENTCCKTPLTNDTCYGPWENKNSKTKKQSCEDCGGVYFVSTSSCRYLGGMIPGTLCSGSFYFDQGLGTEEYVCGNDGFCNGKLNAIRRIDYAKSSSLYFINKVFNLSTYHRVAILNYSGIIDHTNLFNFSDKTELLDYTNSNNFDLWIASDIDHQKTNICKALDDAKNIILSNSIAGQDRYRTIVLMTDGEPNVFCNGTGVSSISDKESVKQEIYNKASEINNSKIHIYTISIGKDANKTILQKIAEKADGTFVSSDNLNDLDSLYDTIAYNIKEDTKRYYETLDNYDHLIFVFYNSSLTWKYNEYNLPLPLETKKYTLPEGEILNSHINNITKIEIYMGTYTVQDHEEIIGPMLDSINVKSN